MDVAARPTQRCATWELRCAELKIWVADHDARLPNRNIGDVEEKYPAQWMSQQHTKIKKGLISDEHLSLLREVPGMEEWMAKFRNHARRYTNLHSPDALEEFSRGEVYGLNDRRATERLT